MTAARRRRSTKPETAKAEFPLEACQHAVRVCASFNLKKAVRIATRHYDDALRPIGLRSGQYVILLAVRLLGDVRMATLAEAVVGDPATMSRNVQPLIQRGLLQHVRSGDQRERLVRLTARGHAALREGYPLWQEIQARVEGLYGAAHFPRLLSLLETMASWKPGTAGAAP